MVHINSRFPTPERVGRAPPFARLQTLGAVMRMYRGVLLATTAKKTSDRTGRSRKR